MLFIHLASKKNFVKFELCTGLLSIYKRCENGDETSARTFSLTRMRRLNVREPRGYLDIVDRNGELEK
jgi:hypothetical protein